ncbi:hypothetical protein AJ88_20980 [Mesorhizobium amorphae CCBAU 01583]|nr:hypothetical protein AJ88_20980 [Mesorhizobium amorphae CCBAU 01583]
MVSNAPTARAVAIYYLHRLAEAYGFFDRVSDTACTGGTSAIIHGHEEIDRVQQIGCLGLVERRVNACAHRPNMCQSTESALGHQVGITNVIPNVGSEDPFCVRSRTAAAPKQSWEDDRGFLTKPDPPFMANRSDPGA